MPTTQTDCREAITEREYSTASSKQLLVAVIWATILSTTLVLLTNWLCPSHYEEVDNIFSTMILSGCCMSTTPDYHNLYSNVLWTYPLMRLYQMMPHVCIYSISLFSVIVASLSITATIFIQRFKPLLGTLVFLVFYLSSAIFVVNNLEYTSVGAIAAQSGFLLAIWLLPMKKLNFAGLGLATVFIVLSSLIRFEPFGLVAALYFAFLLISTAGRVRFQMMTRYFVWLTIVLATCLSLKAFSDYRYNTEAGWIGVRDFLALSPQIADDKVLEHNVSAELALAKLGLTKNDIHLLSKFFMCDKEVYATPILKQALSLSYGTRRLAQQFEVKLMLNYLGGLLTVAIAACLVIDRRKLSWRRVALWIAAIDLLMLYLGIFHRVPLRVYLSVLICVSSTLVLYLQPEKISTLTNAFSRQKPFVKALIATGVSTAMLLATFSFLYQNLWLPTLAAQKRHELFLAMLKALQPNPSQLYLGIGPSRLILATPWEDLSSTLSGFEVYPSSQFSRTPVGETMLRKHGMTNLLDALARNNVFVMANSKTAQRLTVFCREHYHKDLTLDMVLDVSGVDFAVYRPNMCPSAQ